MQALFASASTKYRFQLLKSSHKISGSLKHKNVAQFFLLHFHKFLTLDFSFWLMKLEFETESNSNEI